VLEAAPEAPAQAQYSEAPEVAPEAPAESPYSEVLEAAGPYLASSDADALAAEPDATRRAYLDAADPTALGNGPGASTGHVGPQRGRAEPRRVSTEAKQAMRDAAVSHVQLVEPRLRFKERELAHRGWALLPMEDSGRLLDDDAFKTVYHYPTQSEADRKKHGGARDGKRDDFIVRLVDGKLVRDEGEALDTTSEPVPNFTKHTALKELDDRAQAAHGRGATDQEKRERMQQLAAAGGRFIFIMTGEGDLYAGKNIPQIQHHSERGVSLGGVQVEVAGIAGKFASAAELMDAIDPSRDPTLFDPKAGVAACNRYLNGRGGA